MPKDLSPPGQPDGTESVATRSDVRGGDGPAGLRRLADVADARLDVAFYRAPNGLSISELETGRYIDLNEAYSRLLEFSRDELIGRKSTELGIWARPEERTAVVEHLKAHGFVRDWQIEGQTKSGRHLVVLMDAEVVEIDRRRCLITNLRDVTEQRRMEQAIRESEGRYRALIEHSPESVVLHRDNRIILGNRAALDLIGATRIEQVIGHPPLEFVHADSQKLAAERVQRIMAGAPVAPMVEMKLVRLDGTVREVESISTGVTIDGLRSIMVLMRDQTERKFTERALRLSEEKFARAFRATPDAVTISRISDGIFIDVNEGFETLTGYTREESIGRSSIDLDIWIDEAAREEVIAGLRKSGHVRNFERAFRMKNGSLRFCGLSAELTEISGEPCMIAVTRDLSQQRAAEAALRESEERYRLVTEQTGQLIYDFDFTTRTNTWAGAVEKLTGYTPAEFAAVDAEAWRRMIHPDDLTHTMATIRRATEGHEAYQARYRLRRKNGSFAIVQESGFFIADATGRVVRMLGLIDDVTERERLETELLQSQKMETVGRLAGGIAHDFNNLLTVILGHLALLNNDSSVPEEWRRSLGEVNRAAEMAAGLTRQLLTASRQQPLQRSPLDLREVVEGMGQLLGRTLGEDIQIRVSAPEGLVSVLADRGSIEQVLLNLCVNARDAMPSGGRLDIEAAVVDVDDRHVRKYPQARPGRFVRLSVHDTGCGIAPQLLSRIFEPFFTTKVAGHGTGLGLATVYAIVKQHEGWLEVRSIVDRGSTFSAYLPPVGAVLPQPAREQAPARPAIGHGETVFLVEDERAVRKLVELILTRNGFRVITASSGREALEHWDEMRPHFDLLVTDVVMPERVNGRELADRLRSMGVKVPVVFMSGYRAGVIEEVSAENGEFFIQKPFTVDAFVHVLQRALEPRNSSASRENL